MLNASRARSPPGMHMTHSPYCIDITTNQPGSHHDNVKPMHVFEPARPDERKRVGLDSRQFWVAARVKKTKFWLQHERYAGYLADIFGAVGRSTEDVAMVLCRPEHSEPRCKPQNLAKKGRFGDFLRFSTLSSVLEENVEGRLILWRQVFTVLGQPPP